jgi:hypothetical protein
MKIGKNKSQDYKTKSKRFEMIEENYLENNEIEAVDSVSPLFFNG